MTAAQTARAYHARLEDRHSALVATFVMAAMAGLLGAEGEHLLPAPLSVAVLIVYLVAIVFTLTFTLGRYQEKIEAFTERFGQRLNSLLAESLPEERYAAWLELRQRWQDDHEGRRKTPHLMMGIFWMIYAFLGYLVLRGAWDVAYGGIATDAPAVGEGIRNLYLASHSGWLVAGHLFGLFCALGLLFVILPTELLRLRFPELSYPFKATILSRLRKRESGLFGAHYYIAASVPFSILVLTRDPSHWDVTIPAVFALIGVTVFADAASALVGIRYGRTKWPHNPNKSLLGSLGGTLVAVVVALPFVGLPVALASGLVFLIVDVLAPVPFSVSDNLLNPLALAGTYLLLQADLVPMIPYY